jgi:hypothetical protein
MHVKKMLLAYPVVCLMIAGCNSAKTGPGVAGGVGGTPSPPAANLSTPKDAAISFGRAVEAGDVAQAQAVTITDAPTKELLAAMVPLVGAMKKLDAAAVAKFGEAGKNVAGSDSPGAQFAGQFKDAEVKETGDTATVTPKKGAEPLMLKKVGGEWKVDLAAMTKGPNDAQAMAMVLPMFKQMTKSAEETTVEITSGKYKTVDEAKKAFNAKMMGGAFGAMGQAPGGPGQPGMGQPGTGQQAPPGLGGP